MAGTRKGKKQAHSLFDELIKTRDEQRDWAKNLTVVVEGDKLPQETNPLGMMKWYLHPSVKNTALRNLVFWVQEIPPGSKSGRLKFQGGTVIYVWQGRGHTVINDKSYQWSQGDLVQIPIRSEGADVQHFNNDSNEPARLVCCEVNVVDSLGVDRGSGFEVLESCPEFGPG